MRRLPIPRLLAFVAAGSAALLLVASDAAAQWPPPASATRLSSPTYWPNDPGYAYIAPPNNNNGQWNFYSFLPQPATGIRPQETASGMSIDLAWRYTTGHTKGQPEIILAITDSGIEWDSSDVINQAWLNIGELGTCKPTHADGSACGGTGAIAGFDCNGDGIVTVADYAGSLTDKNGNGVLDAGDIIIACSDGIDEDHNGYIDDISGWDFFKDDNDPYDDTRYGHGTGEANDSTAETNNMLSSAGACPGCRFLPLRAGDSFITDVTGFGKAVVYATDNGANIIQCALGTINMNRFAQQALDYAYDNGVLSINSMADENSRHHNMPTASNHTTPVHAITYDGDDIFSSTTYLAFNPCSNFGGQNLLSASGDSCSSEATGKLAGISGLILAAAQQAGLTPKLTPGEAQSLLFMTADDIYVPESELPGSRYDWSQPGFEQRFGYGRVNANSAVEAVLAQKIPPAVDITSPTWFSILYQDQVVGPVDIKGTISAHRANSFDFVAEWGKGVQPLDGTYTTFAQQMNIPPTTVLGGDGSPLASLDIRNVDPTHPRDNDSPHGENDTAITVRVRAVAHYGGSIGDVNGEMRRTYYVMKDPSLVQGFPLYLGDSGEGSPKLADIDGDGVRDLVYPTGGGYLHVYKIGPTGPVELPGFPAKTNIEDGLATPAPTPYTPVYLGAPGYATGAMNTDLAREPLVNAPAIADLDGDGTPEIVFTSWSGTIYVVEHDGSTRPGWPVRLPLIPSCPPFGTAPPTTEPTSPCMGTSATLARGAFASPVLIDMNNDGKLDIIQAAFDGKIYIFDASGQPLDGWPVSVHYKGDLAGEPNLNRILTTPAVADFNGDGIPDLLVGSNEQIGGGGQAGAVYILDGRGTKAPSLVVNPNWPITMTSLHLFPLVAEGIPNSGVIGRFGGTLAAVMHGNASLPMILPADPGKQTELSATPPNAIPQGPDPNNPGQTLIGIAPSSDFGPLSTATQPDTMFPLFAQPSLGDIDQDGVPDVVASGGSLNLAADLQSKGGSAPGDNLLAIWSGKTGAMMPASPFVLEDFTFFNSQAIADLNGDGYPEVITGSGGYFVHAFDGCGREPAGFPKFTGQWIIPTVAVGDLDGDGLLELVVGTRDGWLYAWHTAGTTTSTIEWESYHHDNQNTGNLETPLTQGGKHLAATPLTAALCTATTTPATVPLTAVGGCDCEAATGRGETGGAGTAALLGLGMAVAARRRRRAVR
jgi:hypothetical protein